MSGLAALTRSFRADPVKACTTEAPLARRAMTTCKSGPTVGPSSGCRPVGGESDEGT